MKMYSCYDCIHCEACSDAGDSGFSCLKDDVSKCKHFKNKSDYAEVKHGEWVWTEEGEEDYEQFWKCSKCGERAYFLMRYCSNCGAKMDGKE